MKRPESIKALKVSGYRPQTVKQEMRRILVGMIERGENLFPGIVGYEKTVLPQIENALMSGHDFILLGLRGQAKTRILRQLVRFLDEWAPAIEGCELNDDPLNPVCPACKRRVATEGDGVPIRWIHRDERYREKLATPDVTIADLIGDIDPIKAADQSRDLRHQRASGPPAQDPGGAPQYPRRKGHPDPRFSDPAPARRSDRVLGEPGGLYEPR